MPKKIKLKRATRCDFVCFCLCTRSPSSVVIIFARIHIQFRMNFSLLFLASFQVVHKCFIFSYHFVIAYVCLCAQNFPFSLISVSRFSCATNMQTTKRKRKRIRAREYCVLFFLSCCSRDNTYSFNCRIDQSEKRQDTMARRKIKRDENKNKM